MQLSKAPRMAALAIAACTFVYFVPIFRVRKLESPLVNGAKQNAAPGASSGRPAPGDIAGTIDLFWKEHLPQSVKQAVSVDELLALAAKDPKEAQKKYGREVGLGGPTFVIVRGQGKIESINEDECSISIPGMPHRVVLILGVLLGNAVRDATDWIKVEDFPNSQDFNNLSAELNTRCEVQVIEPVRSKLIVGADVEFAGCGETRDGEGFSPLKLIPVQLRIVGQGRGRE